MVIKALPHDLSVCKLPSLKEANLDAEFFCLARTDEEISLVITTKDVPSDTTAREDGWKAFRIQGVLDFSLIGILSRITTILAENNIGIFAVSTYNTDYILVKRDNFSHALTVLKNAGYEVME